jgi:hypothetical protein
MLKLRRARVVRAEPTPAPEQGLAIVLEGDEDQLQREAVADTALVGRCAVGDDVVVNVEARDLELGSGGFDVVHVNLTRGLMGDGSPGLHVMKLNYTSLQHAVDPVEGDVNDDPGLPRTPLRRPVAALALHGQLAPVAWSYARGAPGCRLGYVQTAGGALPGGHSRVVRQLLEDGLLAGHITAGAAFGGMREAISTAGALQHGLGELGWEAAVCGPGPGIVGSASSLGHGGMSALDSTHSALALGCATVLVPRMSAADPRPRHRDLLLESVTVALPQGLRSPVGAELGAGLGAAFGRPGGETGASTRTAAARELGDARPARIARHDWRRVGVDLAGYASSGLPAVTMGRTLVQDPLFFGAALAGGTVLAALLHGAAGNGDREPDADEEEDIT